MQAVQQSEQDHRSPETEQPYCIAEVACYQYSKPKTPNPAIPKYESADNRFQFRPNDSRIHWSGGQSPLTSTSQPAVSLFILAAFRSSRDSLETWKIGLARMSASANTCKPVPVLISGWPRYICSPTQYNCKTCYFYDALFSWSTPVSSACSNRVIRRRAYCGCQLVDMQGRLHAANFKLFKADQSDQKRV